MHRTCPKAPLRRRVRTAYGVTLDARQPDTGRARRTPGGGGPRRCRSSSSATVMAVSGSSIWKRPTDSITVGRRYEADISLPWDPEASRLHAELVVPRGRVDDLRRRLVPERHLGQRAAARRPPPARRRRSGEGRPHDHGLPPARRSTGPGRRWSRPSCRPRRASPSSSSASCARSAGRCSPTATASTRRATSRSPRTTGIDVDVVTQELDLLARLFGLEDMPRPERRAEVALLAVRSGLVGADEGGTQAELTLPAAMRAFVAEKTDDGVTRGLREDFEPDGDGDARRRRVVERELQGRAGDDRQGPGGADLAAGPGDRPRGDAGGRLAGARARLRARRLAPRRLRRAGAGAGGVARAAAGRVERRARRWRSGPPATPRRAA